MAPCAYKPGGQQPFVGGPVCEAVQPSVEDNHAPKWPWLCWKRFAAHPVRLQLPALAYNLANSLRTAATPELIEQWSRTFLREPVLETAARLVRHVRFAVFQIEKAAQPRTVLAGILGLMNDWGLPATPSRHER